MPVTLVLAGLAAKALFAQLSWAEAFLLGAVLTPTDPVVTSSVVSNLGVPARVRHTLNLESGLNDGLALPFVLFFLVLAEPGGDAPRSALEFAGEAGFGRRIGAWRSGAGGGWLVGHVPGGAMTARYEGVYALGLALLAFGLAEATIGNGLIAAFVGRDRARRQPAGDAARVHRLQRERERDAAGRDVRALRRADRQDWLQRGPAGAARVHAVHAAGGPAGRGAAVVPGYAPGPLRAAVHGVVRAQGRRLDAVRAARGRVDGAAPP